jgi:hypothetical protein
MIRQAMTRSVLASLLALGWVALVATSAEGAITITSFTAETANTLAGAHPDANTTFAFRPTVGVSGEPITPSGGVPRNLTFQLPPGFVGNVQAAPQCSQQVFEDFNCPADTQVGAGNVVVVSGGLDGEATLAAQVYNLGPPPNAPALLGIEVDVPQAPVVQEITSAVHASDDYAVTLTLSELRHLDGGTVLASNLTLWGVPADPSHDALRACEQVSSSRGFSGGCASDASLRPFLENPTSCAETPLTTFSVDTYSEPGVLSTAMAASPNPTDCGDVPFAPSISLTPETTQAGAPTGLSAALTIPQSEVSSGRGTSELTQAILTLPAGMTISPSAASKELQGCSDMQFGTESDLPAICPEASVIGEDEVETPLLPGPLKGQVFLGEPLSTDPMSGQMFRVFLELQGFGSDIKIKGSVVANPETGQLTATFASLPELPFQNLRLHLNGGPNAVLVNSQACGANTTTTQLYPYTGNPPAAPSSTFTTTYDGNGAPCPATLPFAPSSSIFTASSQAGSLSPLSVQFARADETQPLGRIDVTLPEGLLGYVSEVPLCEAAQAVAGTCPPESRVGTVSTTAGAGTDPLNVRGSVYLGRGSNGYPFMLSVVVPAVAGPYDLGDVVVPVWLQVNSNGSITAISGALPSILDGIPLDIDSITMTLDRPGFTVNPTNCAPLSLTGSVSSLSNTVAPISAPFQTSGCGSLPFAPSFTTATRGSTSKAAGASLTVRITQKPGETDIQSVHVRLPKQLPSRLTTLQKACPEAQFNSNPAGCPPGAIVGTTTATTPTLSLPLTGPAILVSHGGAAFPDMEIVLQGEGVTVILDGQTNISKGITSSTFASVPDVPISGFELTLPEGPYSLLAANGTLCTTKLSMPTTIIGQNGAVRTQSTRIAVTGCVDPKPTVTVVKAKTEAGDLVVTLKTTARGTVKLSGNGLLTTTKTNVKAGIRTILVTLTRSAQALRAHHGRLRLKASLTVGRLAVTKTTGVKLWRAS